MRVTTTSSTCATSRTKFTTAAGRWALTTSGPSSVASVLTHHVHTPQTDLGLSLVAPVVASRCVRAAALHSHPEQPTARGPNPPLACR